MSKSHLVTGATGFVGGRIALELLRRTDSEIYCLVRPSVKGDPKTRLVSSLKEAAAIYDLELAIDDALERCHVIPGDITRPACGVDPAEVPEITDFWHSAASLEFEDHKEEEIRLQNVGGTKEVIALARLCGSNDFNYVSTAYVAGNREGTILEELPDPGRKMNNAYERSKVAAELLVAEAPFERVRILRPGIVIGDSRTYGATAFTGMYGFTRGLVDLQREVTKRLGDFLSRRALRMQADPTVPLGLVPVDSVARNAVTIGLSDSRAQIFHLTNACPPAVGDTIQVIADAVGVRTPRYVGDDREFTTIDREVDARLAFYRSYISGYKEFDRSNADSVTGSQAAESPLPVEALAEFVDWYLTRIGASRNIAVAAV